MRKAVAPGLRLSLLVASVRVSGCMGMKGQSKNETILVLFVEIYTRK